MRYELNAKLAIITLAALLSSCGSYSHLRPADPVGVGTIELSGGAAMNSVPETIPVVQANVGITNWLDVGAQWEVYSMLGWLRLIPFNTADDGIAVAFTLGGGSAYLMNPGIASSIFDDMLGLGESGETTSESLGVLGGITIGRRFKIAEPYLGYRILYFPEFEGWIQSAKLGARFYIDQFYLGAEAGATSHHGALTLAEGALYLGLNF